MRFTATILAAVLLVLVPAGPAAAHHGWSEFDTRYAYYVAGTLTDVNWGNPHVEATIQVEATAVPDGWLDRELPAGLAEIGGHDTMAATRPYDGSHQELHLVLASIEYFPQWGLDRRLEQGERIELVGYLHKEHSEELRPETFWLATGQAVRQRLLSLPDQPVPATEPRTDQDPSTGASAAPANEDTSATLVWVLTGGAVLVLLAGAGLYLRRRGNRD